MGLYVWVPCHCHPLPPLCLPSHIYEQPEYLLSAPQVHKYISTGLANSKFGIRNSHLQVHTCGAGTGVLASLAESFSLLSLARR